MCWWKRGVGNSEVKILEKGNLVTEIGENV